MKTTGKGAGGEIQLTDALLKLLAQSSMQVLMMRGRSFDCGNKLGFLEANLVLGLQDESIASKLVNILEQTLADRSRVTLPPNPGVFGKSLKG